MAWLLTRAKRSCGTATGLMLYVYTDLTALPTVAAMEKLPMFAILQENAQIDANNPDSAVYGLAH